MEAEGEPVLEKEPERLDELESDPVEDAPPGPPEPESGSDDPPMLLPESVLPLLASPKTSPVGELADESELSVGDPESELPESVGLPARPLSVSDGRSELSVSSQSSSVESGLEAESVGEDMSLQALSLASAPAPQLAELLESLLSAGPLPKVMPEPEPENMLQKDQVSIPPFSLESELPPMKGKGRNPP